jgi:hypothetical protein
MSKLAAQFDSAQSKFAGFLKENKIDPVRVVYASEQIEKFTPADRSIKLAKRQSGRPVTSQLVTRALKGETLTGAQKSRILRALTRIAEQKKLGEIAVTNVF